MIAGYRLGRMRRRALARVVAVEVAVLLDDGDVGSAPFQEGLRTLDLAPIADGRKRFVSLDGG